MMRLKRNGEVGLQQKIRNIQLKGEREPPSEFMVAGDVHRTGGTQMGSEL
jgi:hypothetical protein